MASFCEQVTSLPKRVGYEQKTRRSSRACSICRTDQCTPVCYTASPSYKTFAAWNCKGFHSSPAVYRTSRLAIRRFKGPSPKDTSNGVVDAKTSLQVHHIYNQTEHTVNTYFLIMMECYKSVLSNSGQDYDQIQDILMLVILTNIFSIVQMKYFAPQLLRMAK